MADEWVQSRGFWRSKQPLAKGVWALQDGGFLIRYSTTRNGARVFRLKSLPLTTSLSDAVSTRATMMSADQVPIPTLALLEREPSRYFEDLSPTDRGAIVEQIVIGKLMGAGARVLKPTTVERYDLLIDAGDGVFHRVQVKTGLNHGDYIQFMASSLNYDERSRSSYVGEVEAFAVYCPELEALFLVPAAEIASTSAARLRLTKPRNNQEAGVLYADTYRLRPLPRRPRMRDSMCDESAATISEQ